VFRNNCLMKMADRSDAGQDMHSRCHAAERMHLKAPQLVALGKLRMTFASRSS
jgi:hypothetical protein